MSVNVDQIVISDEFKHSDEGFRFFIVYQEGEIVKPLCIILPQMSEYFKYFENGGKKMSFLIKDDEVWEKYAENWDAVKNKLGIQFHCKPIYDQKYWKAEVKDIDSLIKIIFFFWGGGGVIIRQNKYALYLHCLHNYWFGYEKWEWIKEPSASLFRRV